MEKKSCVPSNWNLIIQLASFDAEGWACEAVWTWSSSRSRIASPMIPLESSARRTTRTAAAIAFSTTTSGPAGSPDPAASRSIPTASCICRPCAFAASHRCRSVRVRINPSTTSPTFPSRKPPFTAAIIARTATREPRYQPPHGPGYSA
jgi:hypothetical protein